DQGRLDQDARRVKTKFSKSFTTWFFPVGHDIREIVVDWVRYLRQEKLWGLDDPLFPSTKIVVGDTRHFEVSGLDCKHWSSAGPIRTIFKDAFAAAGLPYFNPHSFRKTLALLGGQICKSPEEYKAWSQNLGHESVLTTFSSYGDVGRHRQSEIISALAPREQRASGELVLGRDGRVSSLRWRRLEASTRGSAPHWDVQTRAWATPDANAFILPCPHSLTIERSTCAPPLRLAANWSVKPHVWPW